MAASANVEQEVFFFSLAKRQRKIEKNIPKKFFAHFYVFFFYVEVGFIFFRQSFLCENPPPGVGGGSVRLDWLKSITRGGLYFVMPGGLPMNLLRIPAKCAQHKLKTNIERQKYYVLLFQGLKLFIKIWYCFQYNWYISYYIGLNFTLFPCLFCNFPFQ